MEEFFKVSFYKKYFRKMNAFMKLLVVIITALIFVIVVKGINQLAYINSHANMNDKGMYRSGINKRYVFKLFAVNQNTPSISPSIAPLMSPTGMEESPTTMMQMSPTMYAMSMHPSVSLPPTNSDNDTDTMMDARQANDLGIIMLQPQGNKTIVTIRMKQSAVSLESEPAHIHTGVCPKSGSVVYPLTNVINGISTTTLNVSINTLMNEGNLSVNVHHSDLSVLACGDLQFNKKDMTNDMTQLYSMRIVSNIDHITPNKPTDFSFQIIENATGSVVKDFMVTHTKIMHFLIVRKDLQYFQHVHPTFDSMTGTFSIKLTFPTDGPYRLYPDFMTPTMNNTMNNMGNVPNMMPGIMTITVHDDVFVGNMRKYQPVPVIPDRQLTTSVGVYSIMHTLSSLPLMNIPFTYMLTVKKNHKPVTDLQPYLDALGHAIVIDAKTLEMYHLHDELPGGMMGSMNPNMSISPTTGMMMSPTMIMQMSPTLGMDMSPTMSVMSMHTTGMMPSPTMPISNTSLGPNITFTMLLPKSGVYKIFSQFQHMDTVNTDDYVIRVK